MTYNLSTAWTIAVAIGVIWELAWKGFALWKASRKDQKGWFVAILLVNSVGILPIIYLLTHMERPRFEEHMSHERALPFSG